MKQRTLQAYLAAALVAALACPLGATIVRAQQVGTVVAVEGVVEIEHLGSRTPATIGTVVQLGDVIRTTRPGGRLQLACAGDSALNIGEGADLTVKDFVFAPERKQIRSSVQLRSGKVRPVVGAEYSEVGAVYEVETATAMVKVHGTEFVVAYDPVGEVSDVVGITGTVEVRGAGERPGRRGVFVTTQQLSTVAKGQLPTPAQPISDKLFRQYIEDLQFIGGGQAESQSVNHPLLAGEIVPGPDRFGVLPPPSQLSGERALEGPVQPTRKPPSPLVVAPPGDDWPGTCVTVGCFTDGPPGASRTTGDIGIKY